MATRRRRRQVSVKRGDAAEVIERDDTTTREGQLLDLREPQFLSIVKAPANRSPFKIVRDDEGPSRRRRRKTSDGLLSVSLPEEVETAEEAEAIFQRFGLSEEEYEIEAGDSGYKFKRKRQTGDEVTVPIQLANGITAHIEAAALQRGMPEGEDHPGITVLRFDFLSRSVGENWLRDHSIDAEIGKWLETDDIATFCRHDVEVPEDAQTIDMDGVTVTVAQTREDDVPVRIYRQVVEEMYGSFGWGIIDFNQMMANEVFHHDAKNANYMLWDVIDNILFYSELPLADRQALVMNALNQFAVWLTNLMSALPRSMTEPDNRVDLNSQGTSDDNAARSENDPSDELSKETADMSKDKEQKAQGAEDQETVERQDTSDESKETEASTDEKVEREDEVTETEEEKDTEKVFTRSEAESIAAAAVQAHIDKVEQKQREDESPASQIASALKEVMEPVVKRMENIEAQVESVKTTTVAREDTDDPEDPAVKQEEQTEEVKRHDPYRGSIFGDKLSKVYS